MTKGRDGVGTLITRLVNFHCDWSSGFRDSSVALHWSFLHSLRPLKAVDLGFQSGVPGDLPTSSQPVFQAYFILNTDRDLGAWVSNRATLRCGSFQSPKNGAGKVLNTRVDIHTIMQFRGGTEFRLPGGSGICPSQCARYQVDLVGFGRMSDTYCR